jgi:hypothetical protein
LPAAEVVLGQVPRLCDRARSLAGFLVGIAPRLRVALESQICVYPELDSGTAYQLAAVDSASRVRSTAGLTLLMAVAFKTSATRSEEARAALEHLDGTHEQDAVSRLVRNELEAQLLSAAALGADQLVILDNSFLSLAEDASRAWLALERTTSALVRPLLERYCRLHLGPEGSLLGVLSNAGVIALPKVAEAQSLVRELYQQLDLSREEQQSWAALAQRDRLVLRSVLRPGEYLTPRNLLGHADRTAPAQRDRFFHRASFPDREPLLDLYGVGRSASDSYGIDVVYFRPRRPSDAADGPVLRLELNRQLSSRRHVLERVLATVESAGDGEHPEPMPQLLADQIAKSSVSSVLDALVEASVIELLEEPYEEPDGAPSVLDVIGWLHEEARS